MNNPQYILTDVFGEIAAAIKVALNLTVLNYQYGYITELNQTLQQWNRVSEYAAKRYPLLWLAQPFTIRRGRVGFYGDTSDLRLFIIQSSSANLKASERMEQKFRPVIYPIYSELLNQIKQHPAFDVQTEQDIKHNFIDRYFWGEEQQKQLNDIVDCSEINGLSLRIHNNQNCIITSNF